MREFIQYEKLSKRKKREIDRMGRRGWGEINPVTRRPERPGVYTRSEQKALIRLGKDEADKGLFLRCNLRAFVR